MDRLNFLLDKSNSFSQKDITNISEHLFNVFLIDYDEMDRNKVKNRSEILNLFMSTLNKFLYSELIEEKKDKLEIVLMINQLKVQKELLELFNSDDPDKRLELEKVAERFGRKSQSSI